MADEEGSGGEVIGPARPPPPPSSQETSQETPDDSQKPKRLFGPSLDLLQKSSSDEPSTTDEVEDQRQRYDVEVGPRPLPAGFKVGNDDEDSDDEANDIFTGPVLKKIYPHMVTTSTEKEEKKDGREEWMLTVPKDQNPYAVVQARQFSKRDSTISSADKTQGAQEWTETPAERDERLRLGKRSRAEDDLKTAPVLSRQEEETKRLMEEYNKRFRPESLFDKHQREVEEKKRKEKEKAKKRAKKEKEKQRKREEKERKKDEKKKGKKKDKDKDKKKHKKHSSSGPPLPPMVERKGWDRDRDIGGPRLMDPKKLRGFINDSQNNDRFGRPTYTM